MSNGEHTIAVYSGSFDLFTNGHLEVARKAARCFDIVILLVANDPAKNYMFNQNERLLVASCVAEDLSKEGYLVEAHALCDGYVTDYAHQIGASVLVRGLRDVVDYESETKLANVNRSTNPEIETVFIPTPPELGVISSSTVKKVFGPRGWMDKVRCFVPEASVTALAGIMMRRKWDELMVDMGLTAPAEYIDELVAAYTAGPNRCYHNAQHIIHGLEVVDEYLAANEADKLTRDVARFAIFYHDAVYDPHARDNESKSAIAALVAFVNIAAAERNASDFEDRPYFYQTFESVLRESILATEHRHEIDEDRHAVMRLTMELVANVDLAILGEKPEAYQRYARQIRQEFQDFSDSEYAKGRVAVLQRFLDRDCIYSLPWFVDRYELQARRNIQSEIDALVGKA